MMLRPSTFRRLVDLQDGRVEMAHGGGGRAMAQLIEELFVANFDNDLLRQGNDQACFPIASGRLAMTTDSFVISPLFFPGGDIGALAVNGTVNDLAMAGAEPLYLTAGFILEEGFPLRDLKRIVQSMARAAKAAGTAIVTGDTKVVERGKGDGVFINTAGLGRVPAGIDIAADRARPGDAVLVSGSIGDHGIAVLSQREGLRFESPVESDSAPLCGLVADMLAVAPDVRVLRDPTRGGLGATLNEIALRSAVGIELREEAIPVSPGVRAACDLLGLDPLYIANEGKLIAICPPETAAALLAAMRAHPLGREAAVIGAARADPHRFVEMETAYGGKRLVDWLAGEQLPRIC
ncbi:MAG: hydrogenase expression/formation protein HypE [Candidatus Schekmanbacteria bacterium]|nr:hydrogenase expression/formation protein HypE [Candidatus Schekmanbacteria bacterium]